MFFGTKCVACRGLWFPTQDVEKLSSLLQDHLLYICHLLPFCMLTKVSSSLPSWKVTSYIIPCRRCVNLMQRVALWSLPMAKLTNGCHWALDQFITEGTVCWALQSLPSDSKKSALSCRVLMAGHLPDQNAIPLGGSAAQTYGLVGTAIDGGSQKKTINFKFMTIFQP